MDKSPLAQQRRGTANQDTVPVAAASGGAVPYDQYRVALVVQCTGAVDVWLSLGQEAAVGKGLLLRTTDAPLVLSLLSHGVMVCGPFNAIGVGGTSSINFWSGHNSAP